MKSFDRPHLNALLVVCLIGACSLTAAASPLAGEPPVQQWNIELNKLEKLLAKVATADTAARERLAGDLTTLHNGIAEWLGTFAPAINATPAWLDPVAPMTDMEALAAELGRLRAVISRVDQSIRAGGDGAFYLGRVDVEVTATASVSSTTELAPVGATVLDAQQLRLNSKVGLADALAMAPGVSFSRIGQRNEASIYVRGFDLRQVPVFVDGIPVYTPYDGYADLDRFTTFDVAELRVSKGFSSVLYGANALGGAINVVSRRPNGRVEGLAGASIGFGPSRTAYLNLGTKVDRWYAQGGGSYLQADGYPLSGDFTPVKVEDGGDRNNAYRRDAKFNVKLGATARGGDEYALSYVGQRGKKGNPPYAGTDPAVKVRYWQWPYWDKDSLYAITNTNLGRAGYLRGRAFYDIYDNALYAYDDASFTTQVKPSSFKSLYHDNTIGGSVEWGTVLGSRQTVRTAFHLKNDYHEENNVGDPVQRKEGRIISVGIEDSVTLSSRLSMVAGISGDWQTTRKAENLEKGQIVNMAMGDTSGVNPQLGLFFGIPSGMVRATVSHKTRLPSIKDRYSYKLGTALPNPDLAPERATTYETGFQGALGARTSFQASAFYSRITDLIQRFYVTPNVSQQRNIGEASSAGLEFDLRSRLSGKVEVSGSYSFLHRENISSPTVPLTETPVHKGLVSIMVEPLPRVRVSATADFESGRQTINESGKLFDVPAFGTVGVKATWTIWKTVDLDVSATNLTDKNYWVAELYPEAGRSVMAGLRYRF